MIDEGALDLPEYVAAPILRAALKEGRASELIDVFVTGGCATVDALSGKLIVLPKEAFQ